MQLLDQILGSNGASLDGLAGRFGITAVQAQAAMSSLVPAIVGGMHQQAQAGDPQDVGAEVSNIGQPDTVSGNSILGKIFGSKDVSRQVADHASTQSGVPPTVLKAMLPVVAGMVAPHVASASGGEQANAGSGLGGILSSFAESG